MQETVVTSGGNYSDIDALACGFAYKKMQDTLNIPTRFVLLGPVNESVSKTVRTWNYTFEPTFSDNPNDYKYILVDISDPEYFSDFVIAENIIEIYDHRWGFETLWKQKLGSAAKIDIVGSCATLIWEEYKRRGVEDKIDNISANLLYTAILSNTLNFHAQITKQRDKEASEELVKFTKLPPNWVKLYFSEIEETLINQPLKALTNDTKEITINSTRYTIGQLELWNSTTFIEKHKELLLSWLEGSSKPSFITSPSISQGTNYIFCSDKETQGKLSKAVGASFEGSMGKTKILWLRKEIIRELELLR